MLSVLGCGGVFYQYNHYTIKSPRYPKGYSGNSMCRYEVRGLFSGYGVRLVFNTFDLEESQGCQNDNFAIYEGQIASSTIADIKCGRFTGDFISKSQNVILVFRSNSVISGKGFSIDVDCKYSYILL